MRPSDADRHREQRPATAGRARALAPVALALAMGALLGGGCGDRRASHEGESCARTADCAEPLRCVDLTCLSPARARHLVEARRGPTVPDGAEKPAAGSAAPLGQGPTAADPPAPPAPPPAADAPGGAGRP